MRQWGTGWRLIYDLPTRSGAMNMAVDEAILHSVLTGVQPPTLRLYGWSPPCVSLGYGQRAREIDLARLRSMGWDIVRRPTGGRAILHIDELTYSVVCPHDHPLAEGGILASYQRISRALMTAMQLLGATVTFNDASSSSASTSPVCFDQPGRYEITFAGRKLIGSAQLRRQAGMLQHGTLPLTGDIARLCQVLTYAEEIERELDAERVRASAITLETALERPVSWDEAAHAAASGFSISLGAQLITDNLTYEELVHADEISRTKYARDEWTFRR